MLPNIFLFLRRMQTKVDLLLEYKTPYAKPLEEFVNLLYKEAKVWTC